MNPADLFQCSDVLKSLDAKMREGESERIIVWPKTNVPLSSSPSQNELRYVESTCDLTSILIDPSEVAGCDQQISTLEKHGLLESDFHDRVKMITVKLAEQITELNDDLSINREVLKSFEDFQTVKEIWDRFKVDPLNSFSWNLSWWNAFQSHGDLHLIKFERAGETVGLAPLYVDRWLGLNRLRFLATGDACTDYVDLVCHPEHYELCVYSLAEYIRSETFDVVELDCTRDDRLALLLKQHLGQNYSFDHRSVEPTWRLELPESWEQFRTAAKKSLRRKINKAVRRLESKEFSISSSPQVPIEEAFETLKRLHTLRFEIKGEPGVFADTQFESFLRSAVLDFARDGKCVIVMGSQEGRAIAAQLYFDSADGFQLYQSGYDPDAMKLEPGHLLFTAMVQKAIARGDSSFDFLRGNEPYKEYWGAKPHAQNKLRMVVKKALPTLIAKFVVTCRSVLRKNT